MPQPLVRFSPPLREAQQTLKQFLRDSLYSHPRVRQMTQQAQDTVRFLFEQLMADYERMPEEHAARARAAETTGGTAGRRARRGRLRRRHDRPVRAADARRVAREGLAATAPLLECCACPLQPSSPLSEIAARERLIFALDVPDLAGAKKLVTRLADTVVFYKIGLELATSPHYFELLRWLIDQDNKVFTDLKLYDIPATVGAAVRQLEQVGRVVPDRARRSRDHGRGRRGERASGSRFSPSPC